MIIRSHPPKSWMTPKEYAIHYGVHIQTVYDLIRAHRLPHFVERIGRVIRIDITHRVRTDDLDQRI
jgi:excisionase family DNA binding protein